MVQTGTKLGRRARVGWVLTLVLLTVVATGGWVSGQGADECRLALPHLAASYPNNSC